MIPRCNRVAKCKQSQTLKKSSKVWNKQEAQIKTKIRQSADRTWRVNTSPWIVGDGGEHLRTHHPVDFGQHFTSQKKSAYRCFTTVLVKITAHYFISTYCKWAH